MANEIYSDFVLLWLICHQSRLEGDPQSSCWLEKWVQVASERGTRALDELRKGFEGAIEALGAGYLAHLSNGKLREKLRAGRITTDDYYRQLLRIV